LEVFDMVSDRGRTKGYMQAKRW